MSNFLQDAIKAAGNEYAAIVDDGVEAGDVESFIDTGSEAAASDTATHFVDTLRDRIQRVRSTDQEIKEIVKKERKKRKVKIADSDLSEFLE